MGELCLEVRGYETTQTLPEYGFEHTSSQTPMQGEPPDRVALMDKVLANPIESQTSWPSPNADGTVSDTDYLKRCWWRMGNVGHALDVVAGSLNSAADRQEWLELKMAILAAKSIGSIYDIVDPMLAIEEDGWAFAKRLNMDANAYQQVANK